MGTGLVLYFFDKPFRLVWFASGVEIFDGATRKCAAVRYARSLPFSATSTLSWLAVRVLDDTSDDTGSLALLSGNYGLHTVGNPIRGTRFGS